MTHLDLEQRFARAMKKGEKKDANWYSIGAGRVGDSYKGGKIVEIDAKNARAKVVKSKALKAKKLKVYSDKMVHHYRPSQGQVSTNKGKAEAEREGRKMYNNRVSFE